MGSQGTLEKEWNVADQLGFASTTTYNRGEDRGMCSGALTPAWAEIVGCLKPHLLHYKLILLLSFQGSEFRTLKIQFLFSHLVYLAEYSVCPKLAICPHSSSSAFPLLANLGLGPDLYQVISLSRKMFFTYSFAFFIMYSG